jgi:chemosensory pili system protein ChpA (sensor histidine kinase/response regulator)
MLHSSDVNFGESLNALTDAVVVLPSYLDRLQAGHDDLPILLLPTLNELRATYDESLLSEGTLFAPDLDVIIPELSGSEADAIATTDFNAFARRIRSMYQGALLGWLKEQSRHDLLGPMQKVCRKLHIRLGRLEVRRLWWIAELAMQGLRDGAIDNDLPLRRLFARLDLTLKAMMEGGEEGPASETITALSRALLFYAAQARPGSKAIDTLRERFKLEELIPDRDALLRARGAVTGRDASLFRSIGEAIRDELGQVKDTLDMELRTGRVDEEQREQSVTQLRQLADTLDMLNLPVPARAIEDLLPDLEEQGGDAITDLDSPLLALAQKLLEVEAILNTHIQLLGEPVEEKAVNGPISLPPHEQRQIISSMLDECVSNLQEVQESVRKRLEGDETADYESALSQIAGALGVAKQREVAALTEKLARALNAALVGEDAEQVDGPSLECLTDAIAALELYLAGCRDEQANSLRFLEVMHARLEGLPEAGADGGEIPETNITLPASSASRKRAAKAPDDAGIDPTMLAIFLEEFDAVQNQLKLQLEHWLPDPSNQKLLTEIRRGFHTLKGSGRMVGATEIGDFSWRFEELLNKLTEGRIRFSQDLGESVRLGVAALLHMRARLIGEDSLLDADGINRLGEVARLLANDAQPDLGALIEELPDLSETPVSEKPAAADTRPTDPIAIEQILDDGQIDPTLQQLMIGEIRGQLSELEAFVSQALAGGSHHVSTNLVRTVHTLAGTLSMAPLGQEAEVARSLEHFFDNRLKSDRPVTAVSSQTLQICLHRFHQRLSVLEDGSTVSYPLDDAELIGELAGLSNREDAALEHVTEALTEEEETKAPVKSGTEQPTASWYRICSAKFIPSRAAPGWPASKTWELLPTQWKACWNISPAVAWRPRWQQSRPSRKVATG